MTRSISRDGFNELKNYRRVHLQQGRPILDSDWNESQDMLSAQIGRVANASLGNGITNDGFAIRSVNPIPNPDDQFSMRSYELGGLGYFTAFPGAEIDSFESLDGFTLLPTQGKLRISRERPYRGRGFLRLSDHTSSGMTSITKVLASPQNWSSYDALTFRFRVTEHFVEWFEFFYEDSGGNRTVHRRRSYRQARDVWRPVLLAPLHGNLMVVPTDLPTAVQGKLYSAPLLAAPFAERWDVKAGSTLPPWLAIQQVQSDWMLKGTPPATAAAQYAFTLQATRGSQTAERRFVLRVQNSFAASPPMFEGWERWLRNGYGGRSSFVDFPAQPTNLASIVKYGFRVPQFPTPVTWDFDDLRGGSRALLDSSATNDFIISGSSHWRALAHYDLTGELSGDEGEVLNDLSRLMPSLDTAGRMMVGGLSCVQVHDVRYSEQADPNDPLLTTPALDVGTRLDTVYLDVWEEPVTYIEDPSIREVALGGPDTSTRTQVRHRVRVAQNGGLPSGDGRGRGTLATEGTYTGKANRLYRVEVETPGNIGTAKLRWSEDNASTIQRVIQNVPQGSMTVAVEDASAFRSGDSILLRKEFGEERHEIVSILGNVITLKDPTGTQLASYPANSRRGNFTSFLMSDRPKVQRWNQFQLSTQVDPVDPSISLPCILSDGVQVRLGGRELKKGDYWTFRTRYLGALEEYGIDPATRIEVLEFAPPRGVIHQYVQLATLIRDGRDASPHLVSTIRDERPRAGKTVLTSLSLNSAQATLTPAISRATLASFDLGRRPGMGVSRIFVCYFDGSVSVSQSMVTVRLGISYTGDEDSDYGFSSKEILVGTGSVSATLVAHQNFPYAYRGDNDTVTMNVTVSGSVAAETHVSVNGQFHVVELKSDVIPATARLL